MSARALRRFLDERYERGRADGARGPGPRDPGRFDHRDDKYARWAYDAGFAQGLREFDRWRAVASVVAAMGAQP